MWNSFSKCHWVVGQTSFLEQQGGPVPWGQCRTGLPVGLRGTVIQYWQGMEAEKEMAITLLKYQCFALGMKVNQTILLQYKLLGLLGKSGWDGNPQGDAVYFLICRCIIGFNLYFQRGKWIYITEYYQVIHNCYIINKSNKIKSLLVEAFSFFSFWSQHSHIPKFFLDRANQFKIELISRMSARRMKMNHYYCPVSSFLAPFT